MFLNMLKEAQKNLFLDLAVKAAEASGGISVDEKNVLKEFALEMRISPRYECAGTVAEILGELKRISTEKELKIVTFEILGIMYSDSDYDDAEREFVSAVTEMFGIDSRTADEMENLVRKYVALYTEISDAVLA